MRKAILWGGLGAASLLLAATARDARACGGCFHQPSPTQDGTVVTDHRMIFAVSPAQTTLYDEIQYQGAPSSFAWVLPIHGAVTVGLSSDVLFAALDQVTQTTIVAPTLPPCPSQPFCGCGAPDGGVAFSAAAADAAAGAVNIISQSVVGPYDTVQLQSTDPMALDTWLQANGYTIPTAVQPVIAEYVSEGFDFLALRLAPGQDVQAMRPVSVTSTGAGLSLPLRMVAAGTGATVGITLWVIATGAYEPQNFQTFTISAGDLVWDWSQGSSNYTTLVSQKETALGNAAWQIESALDVSPFQVENLVLRESASNDYLPVPPASGAVAEGGAAEAGAGDSGAGETADEVRSRDLATCFPGATSSVRVTRMRADLSQAALANDLVLEASANQSTMSNVYQVTQSVNAPACPSITPVTCPPCGGDDGSVTGDNEGNSDDGGSSSGSDGGRSSGGESATTGSSGNQSFSCAASSEGSGGGLEIALASLVGISLIRGRRRGKR
jgi:hypothetical protein